MAGFEDLIRGTLQKHGATTPQSRAAIYDSSRQALERMLSQNQTLDLSAQSLQRQRLEKAIADIEASYSTGAGLAPQAAPAPASPPAMQPGAAPTQQPAAAAAAAATPAPSPQPPQPPQPTVEPVAPQPTVEPVAPQPPPAVPAPAPPPIPIFQEQPSAPAEPTPISVGARVEPGFEAPPIPVPPTVPPISAGGAAPSVAPAPQAPIPSTQPAAGSPSNHVQPTIAAPSEGVDAYSEAVAAVESNERKPYAKLLLWTIILVGIGVSFWWAITFGPSLLKQQLGGSVPNPGQTIESGQFDPAGEGWVTAFSPASDSINIETGGRGTAEVFQNANETFVRLASNAGGNDNNLKVLIPRGVMVPLKGSAATIEIVLKSSAKSSQEYAVYCDFASMGSCGRKRFTATDRPEAQIFDVLLNNVNLTANEDAYLSFNSDMGGEGRGIDIYSIRIRANQ